MPWMAKCVSLRARVVNRDASYPMSVPSITCLCAMPLNPPPLSLRSRCWADPLVTWWTCCVALATVRCLVLPGARLAFAPLPPGRPLFGSPAQHPFQVRCISTTADIAVGLHLTPIARATGVASPSFSCCGCGRNIRLIDCLIARLLAELPVLSFKGVRTCVGPPAKPVRCPFVSHCLTVGHFPAHVQRRFCWCPCGTRARATLGS